MRQPIHISIAAIAALMMWGCGGSDSDSTTVAQTDDAYYVDAAVEGATYQCGTQNGVTNQDGRFTFEYGQSCSFDIAGVPLREIASDKLAAGKKFVENNVSVARFLQSLDFDGNPDNGIQIKEEVAQAVQTALQNHTPAEVLSDEALLQTVVATVASTVDGFEGSVPTIEEVEAHIQQTQTTVTMELLAGKTFYVAGTGDGSVDLLEVSLDEQASKLTFTVLSSTDEEAIDASGSDAISIDGNRIVWGDNSYSIVTQENGYIYVEDFESDGTKDGLGHWLYTDRAAAESKYNELIEQIKQIQQEVIDTVSANPWYRIEYNTASGDVYCEGKFTFSSDMSLKVEWKEDGTIQSFNGSYEVIGDEIVLAHDGVEDHESIAEKSTTKLVTDKETFDADTGEWIASSNVAYFANYQDALEFGQSYGVDCSEDIPE